jgi:hypothetical protein
MRSRRLRIVSICGLLGCLLFASSGCLTFVLETSDYFDRQDEIRSTHASITVSGKVVDEEGKYLPSLRDGEGSGIVTITGIRDSVRFQLEGEGAGDSSETVCCSTWFYGLFSIHIDDVREATLVFVRKGYRPATLRVVVPPVKQGAPPPVVVNDAVIVMHADPAVTGPL